MDYELQNRKKNPEKLTSQAPLEVSFLAESLLLRPAADFCEQHAAYLAEQPLQQLQLNALCKTHSNLTRLAKSIFMVQVTLLIGYKIVNFTAKWDHSSCEDSIHKIMMR